MRIPFTDAHMHLWDAAEPSLTYSWLDRGGDPGETSLMGEYGAVRSERYRGEDYAAETRFEDVDRMIHVQSADPNPQDPLAETRWISGVHDRLGFPHAQIAYIDLIAADAREVVERHREYEIFRGVRDELNVGFLADPRWEAGVAALAEHELAVCVMVPIEEAPLALGVARRNPGITFCLDHSMTPIVRREGDFERWRDALRTVSAAPNAVIKISGLGMFEHRWTPDLLRERILTCIEAFGVERAFFGANWPVDRLYSSFGALLNCFEAATADLSEAERRGLLGGNAKRIFAIS